MLLILIVCYLFRRNRTIMIFRPNWNATTASKITIFRKIVYWSCCRNSGRVMFFSDIASRRWLNARFLPTIDSTKHPVSEAFYIWSRNYLFRSELRTLHDGWGEHTSNRHTPDIT